MKFDSSLIVARAYEAGKFIALKWLPIDLLNQVKKRHYLRKVSRASVSDEPDLGALKYLVRPGDFVVDIGANIGVYTVYLSRLVAETGCVFSLEPVRTTFGFLTYNVAKLGLRNVLARRVAVTSRPCKISMMIPRDTAGMDNYYQAVVVEGEALADQGITEVVEGLPLDSILSTNVKRVRFIKCDIEGHELHCLNGAANTLRLSRPAWLMEVGGDPQKVGSNAEKVFSLMREHGYSVWVYQHENLKSWAPGVRSVNYLFLTADHIEQLRAEDIAVSGSNA